jgi:two-component system chemotaxis sensor kinase CheA
MTSREEFLLKIRATFKIEASEGIANITSNLMELENGPPEERQAQLIEAIYREAHSLKGAARAVNISEIEQICQSLESVFSGMKNKTVSMAPGLFNTFHQTVNTLTDMLKNAETGISEPMKNDVKEILMKLQKVAHGVSSEVHNAKLTAPEKPESAMQAMENERPQARPAGMKEIVPSKQDETIRISVGKLDSLLFQAEEMLVLKQKFEHFGDGLNLIAKKLNSWSQEATAVSSQVADIDQQLQQAVVGEVLTPFDESIRQMVNFFDWGASLIKSVEGELGKMQKSSVIETYNSGTKIESLLDEVKKMISVPFTAILDVFPKAARDLSTDIGKEVQVLIRGAGIEIDRRILEEIRNPLMHLLRNCVDHGIEKPAVRKQTGKPERGTIELTIERLDSNKVEITISDDGAGIDLGRLKKKYIMNEKVSAAEADQLDENDLVNYIFKTGISTSDMITDLSGRGLGLAIVQEKIEQLGGSVSVKSDTGKGTSFKMQIPLTLVTFRGVRMLVGDREFISPTSKIDRVFRVLKTEIKLIDNKPAIPLNGGVIPLVFMADILEIPFKESDNPYIIVLIIGEKESKIGFVVDEILDEEVVLVKKFNNQLKRVRNIAGATVLGSGKVIPILNVSDLLKSAIKDTPLRNLRNAVEKETAKKSILVVEDSITSRMLLKNILETAGYLVSTAIDGAEGYAKAKGDHFDLILSDVDMPRMNGFDMTSKIRSDHAIADIPIVLVTSLSKSEDREHGMEVGASAYIVKGSFDQSNLLEVVERLI